MPLHDYECEECGHEFEAVVKWDERQIQCPQCGEWAAFRAYKGFGGMSHDSPEWMKDTIEVVDKEGGQHCQEFLKHPNRRNYNAWMKGEGLRPLEQGEKLRKGPTKEEKVARKRKKLGEMKKRFKAREAITIGV